MTTQEYIKAIEMRHSRRAYKNKPLDEDVKNVIKEMVNAVNESSALDFIFIDDATPAFRIFQGKFSMIAVCGPDSQKAMEDAGYYGEGIVLQCVYHGLGTCWVSGSYNENKAYEMTKLPRNKRLYCVIVIGYPKERENALEKTMFKATHRKCKTYQDMFEACDKKIGEEYAFAMKLVEMAPSAVNRRPVKFRYENSVLSARVEEPYSDQSIDFGIAKLHFVIGCRAKGINGSWSEGNTFEEIKTQKIKFEKEENNDEKE